MPRIHPNDPMRAPLCEEDNCITVKSKKENEELSVSQSRKIVYELSININFLLNTLIMRA